MRNSNKNLMRLFDANINRAVEGIRVLEESARMLLDDGELTRSIKDVRHTIIRTVKSERNLERFLLASRGSEHDVLRSGESFTERERTDILSVVEANAGRAQEALRTLEEYAKLLYPSMSERFKSIRFRIYDIEKDLVLRLRSRILVSRERMRVYVILDRGLLHDVDLREYARMFLNEGAGTIAYSDTKSSDGDFLKQAGEILDICSGKDVTTIICDRLDCAMILGADGVHLRKSGITVNECRRISGQDFVIGYTEETLLSGKFAEDKEADYLIVKFNFREKENKDNVLLRFAEIASSSKIPVIAQCDFTLPEAEKLFENGVAGIVLCPSDKTVKKSLKTERAVMKILENPGVTGTT